MISKKIKLQIQTKLKSPIPTQMPKISKKIKKVHLLSQAQKLSWKDLRKRYQKQKIYPNCQKEMQDVLCKLNSLNSSFPIGPLQNSTEYNHIKIQTVL